MVMEIPYNDRASADVQIVSKFQTQAEMAVESNPYKIPQPEISIIVDGNKIFKPGMKSVFIEDDKTITIGEVRTTQKGSYCSCNTVTICTCDTVCTCEAVQVCTCVGHCACNGQCGCHGNCTCNSQWGCACAPVH